MQVFLQVGSEDVVMSGLHFRHVCFWMSLWLFVDGTELC